MHLMAVTKVLVGCCGLSGLSLKKYAQNFNVIELQSTFYQLPQIETAQRWREEVGDDFEFSIKAFQGITHPITSPTWRRAGSQRPTEDVDKYGHLNPTPQNFRCWEETMAICKVLRSRVCVVQLPSSFTCTDDNVNRMIRFFKSVEKPEVLAIEVRGESWFERPSILKRALEEINGIHIVDPLVRRSVLESKVAYFRLHGLGKRLYDYRYTDDDLERLIEVLQSMESLECYVMFNNLYAKDDATRFKRLLKDQKFSFK
ncbi:MAG: DUF72 domain-containing protein [Nitrososphaerota archaeon]|nr:DUF72 domain-containing protein [Nitrososphaerales archaeon]MDW8044973.1 DUF72 domain-containing protein [Nitrososphaerota archaeon]